MSMKQPGVPENIDIAKAQAKRLAAALNPVFPVKHGQALELVARLHGQESWGHLRALIGGEPMKNGEPFENQANFAKKSISEDENSIILFSNVTSRLVHHTICRAAGWHGKLQQDIHDVILLMEGSEDISGLKKSDLCYFRKITLGDFRAAEHAFITKQGGIDKESWMSDVIAGLFKDGMPQLSGSKEEVVLNYEIANKPFETMPQYDMRTLPVPIISQGMHALYTGASLPHLLDAFPGLVDMTDPMRRTYNYVSQHLRISSLNRDFSNPIDGLVAMIGISIKDYRNPHLLEPAPQPSPKMPIVIKLSDLAACSGPDVFMAQARAMGFFVVVLCDRMDLSSGTFRSISSNTNILMRQDELDGHILVSSASLTESKCGRLKVGKPWAPLTFKDKVSNAVASLRG